jgi:hypothetical protein
LLILQYSIVVSRLPAWIFPNWHCWQFPMVVLFKNYKRKHSYLSFCRILCGCRLKADNKKRTADAGAFYKHIITPATSLTSVIWICFHPFESLSMICLICIQYICMIGGYSPSFTWNFLKYCKKNALVLVLLYITA